jgi:hypothetical protein
VFEGAQGVYICSKSHYNKTKGACTEKKHDKKKNETKQ